MYDTNPPIAFSLLAMVAMEADVTLRGTSTSRILIRLSIFLNHRHLFIPPESISLTLSGLYNMVNSGLAPFPTQNPNFPPEAEPKRPPKTTLTGRAQQQYEEKWFNDQKKANKAKTERGDETCKSRCHHW